MEHRAKQTLEELVNNLPRYDQNSSTQNNKHAETLCKVVPWNAILMHISCQLSFFFGHGPNYETCVSITPKYSQIILFQYKNLSLIELLIKLSTIYKNIPIPCWKIFKKQKGQLSHINFCIIFIGNLKYINFFTLFSNNIRPLSVSSL